MEREVTNNMFSITEPILVDNSIEAKEFKSFNPQSYAEINTSGHTIEIDVPAGDAYYRPSDSFINIKGRLIRADNDQAYARDVQIGLINNALMYLFENIQYSLGGKIVERLNYPGHTTSILGYLSYPDDFNTSTGLKQLWCKDTNVNAVSTKYVRSPLVPAVAANADVPAIAAGTFTPTEEPTYNQGFAARRSVLLDNDSPGSFSFNIPFSHIFGFAEYDKILYNLSHNLKFTRRADVLAIHKANNNVNDGKIILTDIRWIIPKIKPSTKDRQSLLELVLNKSILPVHFCARNDEHRILNETTSFEWVLNKSAGVEKPRWIIVGFQTDKNTTQVQNPAVFDHINLNGACVKLNGDRYPSDTVEIDFRRNNYVRFYEMADEFKREYYGINNLIGGTQINFASYKSLFPLFVFDVRHQSEQVRSNVMSIEINFTFSENVPANTHAYAVILSDRIFKLTSDGQTPMMETY